MAYGSAMIYSSSKMSYMQLINGNMQEEKRNCNFIIIRNFLYVQWGYKYNFKLQRTCSLISPEKHLQVSGLVVDKADREAFCIQWISGWLGLEINTF